jgi:hypothetical protein
MLLQVPIKKFGGLAKKVMSFRLLSEIDIEVVVVQYVMGGKTKNFWIISKLVVVKQREKG